jgi:hypothetical protein
MTIATSATTPAGTYSITVTGAGGATHTTSFSLTVSSPVAATPFDFSLAIAGSGSVTAGQSVSYPVTVGLVSGTPQSVSLSISGGVSGTLSVSSCSPACTSTLTLVTSSSTPAGSYPITVKGTAGSLTHTASLTLTVVAAPGTTSSLTSGLIGYWPFEEGARRYDL